ncbi:MAG: FAD-dependent oxidoreductase, partial [Paracoccaceae bacterium]
MTQRYTAWSLFKQGLAGHRGWRPAWRKATPKPAYDAIVIGGGGHGLATAYYLAKNHGITRVALIE